MPRLSELRFDKRLQLMSTITECHRAIDEAATFADQGPATTTAVAHDLLGAEISIISTALTAALEAMDGQQIRGSGTVVKSRSRWVVLQ